MVKNSMLLISIASLPFIAFTATYLYLFISYHHASIVTPNLIGLSVTQALLEANTHHLSLLILDQKESLHPETVLSQNPLPGALVKKNHSICVVISKKPSCAKAPTLYGPSIPECSLPLQVYPQAKKGPSGHCFAQYPLPEQEYSSSLIAYYQDPSLIPVVIPSFIGHSIKNILPYLEQQELRVNLIHTYPVPDHHRCVHCHVTDQRPLPGSIAYLNKSFIIQLEVSS